MINTLLILDREEKLAVALAELFAEEDVRILQSQSIDHAFEIIRNEPVATMVLGDLLPEQNSLDSLARLKRIAPYAVKILLIQGTDLTRAVETINTGEIFRLVVRPWDETSLRQAVKDALYRYEVVQALKDADESTLRSLGQAIELKDPYTKGHCDRVAGFALLIGKALHLTPDRLTDIRHGSWLHDCGKIGVPENILNYKGELDNPDFEVLKMHPTWGAEVARQANLPEGVINSILHHHERYDGLGYPTGLRGEDIPLEARIVAVADIFDAITTRRPYREEFYTYEEATELMASLSGNVLDPDLVRIFLSRIQPLEDSPPGQKHPSKTQPWMH